MQGAWGISRAALTGEDDGRSWFSGKVSTFLARNLQHHACYLLSIITQLTGTRLVSIRLFVFFPFPFLTAYATCAVVYRWSTASPFAGKILLDEAAKIKLPSRRAPLLETVGLIGRRVAITWLSVEILSFCCNC